MNNIDYQQKKLPNFLTISGISLFVIGILLIGMQFFNDSNNVTYNALIAFMFLTSIGIGSLFYVALDYITGAVWSTPFRRIHEILSSVILALPVFSLPIFFNLKNVFYWLNPDNDHFSHIGNKAYLNLNALIIRTVIIFAVWIVLYILLTRNSQKQDSNKDQLLTAKNIKISLIFFPVFAITLTLFSVDWMMSLEPGWYSSIFGVYYFSGTVLSALAMATLIIVLLNEKAYLLTNLIKDHYYSLGALLFGFTVFWAYIAFGQFLLMWYANLPEETVFFLHRWEGNWKIISIGLILVHFVLPFLFLLPRGSKMNTKILGFASIWILFTHLYDLYWLIMPNFYKSGPVIGLSEIGFILVIFGFITFWFNLMAKNKNLVAIGDPKLQRSIDFHL